MNVLDLFSGIGAFSLGLERAGMRTVAFCEIDPFCRRVLARHWPEVPCFDDVRSLTGQQLRAAGISVDVICGGFPCQDISVAGRGAGIDGERSGLWREFARLIGEIRPRYALVENVAALLGRGLGDVLGDLAALGYDAEWHCIPASAVGAPHIRDRVWIIAHPGGEGRREIVRGSYGDEGSHGADDVLQPCGDGEIRHVAHPTGDIRRASWDGLADAPDRPSEDVADAIGAGLEGCPGEPGHAAAERTAAQRGGAVRDAGGLSASRYGRGIWTVGQSDWWLVEPDVGRVALRVANRVDRLRSLGNSLVPQIPELIGRAILAATASLERAA